MAFGAMTEAFDEVAAAIPSWTSGGIRFERLAVEKQQLPKPQTASDVEGERQIVVARFARDRRDVRKNAIKSLMSSILMRWNDV